MGFRIDWLRSTLFVFIPFMGGCSDFIVNSFAFHPERQPHSTDPLSNARVKEVFFESLDGTRLQAYFIPCINSDRVLLFLHGNDGNALHRLPDALKLADTDTNVFLLDYRGYGRSDGSPTETGVYQDGRAALRYLKDQLGFQEPRTFILGRSIGSAIAVEIAQNKLFAGLILVTPLSTGKDMIAHFGFGWLSWLIGNPFDSLNKIQNVRSPVLFIHGNADDITPLSLGQQLFQASPSARKYFKIVPGGGHGDVIAVAGQKYFDWIKEFMDPVGSSSPSNE